MDSEHSTFNICTKKVRTGLLNNSFLHTLNWKEEHAESAVDYNLFHTQKILSQIDTKYNMIEHFDPMWLGAKANNKYNPNWHKDTNGTPSKGFWRAMDSELETLERTKSW